VEQGSIAELLDFLARKVDVAVGSGVGSIDGLGQPHRQLGDALGMAEGRGVARLDGRHRGLHEAFEQSLDVPVK